MKWYNETNENILNKLNTRLEGLSDSEVLALRKANGKNELPKSKERTILSLFFRQFIDPIIFILIFAATLSLISGEIADGFVILSIIIFNSSLGTFQEHRAGKKAKSLQNMIKVSSRVFRNNAEVIIDSSDLVIGDIVILETGSKVSADIRLLSSYNLNVDEAILTGESIAASKNSLPISGDVPINGRHNMVFAGTSVVGGRGVGVVVATSSETEIGKIASKVLLSDDTKSPLVIRMEKLTKQIAKATAIISVIIAFLLYQKGMTPSYIFHIVVALAVSAIPEGLPIALTFSLSISSSRMSKRNVLVKKLNSVESLGSCTVIASDKTGTLTLNEQTAKVIFLPCGVMHNVTGVGYNGDGEVASLVDKTIIEMGVINNEAQLTEKGDVWHSYGDSIDVAFLALGHKANVDFSIRKSVFGTIPYESENKYSAVFYKDTKIYCTAKGSLEKILDFCTTMDVDGEVVKINKKLILKQNEELATLGYRVIAIARGSISEIELKDGYKDEDVPDLTLLGLVGFIDPIRKDAIAAIDECHKAGIKVVMITGDHPLTAYSISKELGLASDVSQVVTGDDIEEYFNKSKDDFDTFIKNKTVFSRVSPMQKLEIVESYKRMGEFVAVTGDGVNDAPALKAANIGVAVGSGTDVAKETGTMIITDDNFMSIVSGIEEGRIAYSNIRKVIYMLLSTGVAEVLFFMLAILFGYPAPLIAVQLLWLNIVTNGIQDVALSFEKAEAGIMKDKPRSPKENIFDRRLIEETFLSSFVISITVFLLWVYLMETGVNEALGRSYVLLLMVFLQNIHVFNCRSERQSIFKMKISSNPIIFIGISATMLLNFLVTETALSSLLKVEPLPLLHIFYMFVLALPIMLVMEIYKFITNKKSS